MNYFTRTIIIIAFLIPFNECNAQGKVELSPSELEIYIDTANYFDDINLRRFSFGIRITNRSKHPIKLDVPYYSSLNLEPEILNPNQSGSLSIPFNDMGIWKIKNDLNPKMLIDFIAINEKTKGKNYKFKQELKINLSYDKPQLVEIENPKIDCTDFVLNKYRLKLEKDSTLSYDKFHGITISNYFKVRSKTDEIIFFPFNCVGYNDWGSRLDYYTGSKEHMQMLGPNKTGKTKIKLWMDHKKWFFNRGMFIVFNHDCSKIDIIYTEVRSKANTSKADKIKATNKR